MTEASPTRPAIFLDRDGTIIRETNYLASIEALEVFDFAEEALRLFKESGYLVFVLTNQSGIARGYFDDATMHLIHDALRDRLAGLIDAIYFCPHGPDEACDCRKPAIGMIRNAIKDHQVDLANSWMIGDKKSDVETGLNAKVATVLVLTGYGESELAKLERLPDLVAQDLLHAARQICSRDD